MIRCTILFVCFSLYLLLLTSNSVGNRHIYLNPSIFNVPPSLGVRNGLCETNHFPTIKRTVILDKILFFLLISILWLIFLQYQVWLYMCNNTHFIQFDTKLNLFNKKKKNYSILSIIKCSYFWYPLASFSALVLLSEHELYFIHFLLASSYNLEILFSPELFLYTL